jgi:hypothetical protein
MSQNAQQLTTVFTCGGKHVLHRQPPAATFIVPLSETWSALCALLHHHSRCAGAKWKQQRLQKGACRAATRADRTRGATTAMTARVERG